MKIEKLNDKAKYSWLNSQKIWVSISNKSMSNFNLNAITTQFVDIIFTINPTKRKCKKANKRQKTHSFCLDKIAIL